MKQVILIIPLLAILLALILVAFGPLRGWWRFTGRSAAQPWHPIVRVACGLLAIVLVGAVTLASWSATAPQVTAESLFLLAPPASDARPPVAEAADDTPAPPNIPPRVIYTVLAVAVSRGGMVPIDGNSVVVDVSERRSPTGRQTIKGRMPGGTFTSEVDIDRLEADYRNRLAARGHQEISYSTGFGTGWHGGGLPAVGELQIDEVSQWGSARERGPLSILPETISDTIVILSHIAALDADEPQRLSAKDWLDKRKPELNARSDELRPHWRPQAQPNGINMLAYTGPASALLLLAAILASQCFQHRGRAFVGVLVAAVLFAIVMDRIMVERHASWLADHPADSMQRDAVISRMRASFFHDGLAEALLDSTRQ